MQNAIVLLIVAAAVAYLAHRSWNLLTRQKTGCGSCASQCESKSPTNLVTIGGLRNDKDEELTNDEAMTNTP